MELHEIRDLFGPVSLSQRILNTYMDIFLLDLMVKGMPKLTQYGMKCGILNSLGRLSTLLGRH